MKELNQMNTVWAGKSCLTYEVLESTQITAKQLIEKENVHGTLIIAKEQTAGTGRRGRSWQSPKGTNISMSLCLKPSMDIEHVAGLTLVMALAVGTAMEEVAGVNAKIKWPNDLVVGGKKVCGILTELSITKDGYGVIIGTGINVNTEEFPDEIAQIAGSLKLETGREISKGALIVSIMKYFELFYELYEQTEDMTLLKDRYEAMLINKDRTVQVLDPKGPYQGIAKGINENGSLRVVRQDGTEVLVDSGEVSVRGIYGYV